MKSFSLLGCIWYINTNQCNRWSLCFVASVFVTVQCQKHCDLHGVNSTRRGLITFVITTGQKHMTSVGRQTVVVVLSVFCDLEIILYCKWNLCSFQTLAEQLTDKELAEGRLYPPLSNIREVSIQMAVKVSLLQFKFWLLSRSVYILTVSKK